MHCMCMYYSAYGIIIKQILIYEKKSNLQSRNTLFISNPIIDYEESNIRMSRVHHQPHQIYFVSVLQAHEKKNIRNDIAIIPNCLSGCDTSIVKSPSAKENTFASAKSKSRINSRNKNWNVTPWIYIRTKLKIPTTRRHLHQYCFRKFSAIALCPISVYPCRQVKHDKIEIARRQRIVFIRYFFMRCNVAPSTCGFDILIVESRPPNAIYPHRIACDIWFVIWRSLYIMEKRNRTQSESSQKCSNEKVKANRMIDFLQYSSSR